MIAQKSIGLSGNKKLLIILFVAFAIRIYQLVTVCSISGDGPVYIETAKNFYQGDFKGGLAFDYPPAYPILICAAYSVIQNWLIAGRLVSFVFGILTIFPIYFFIKELFGEKVANLTAVFFAFQPYLCKYSARVLPEATYIFLFAIAVWFSWKAISQNKYFWYFLAGALAGLNYLVKPEGLGVAVWTGLYTLVHGFYHFKLAYKRMFISICILVFGTLVFVSPYVLYIKNETGKWQLSKKKSIIVAITGHAVGNSIPDTTLPTSARMPGYSWMEDGGYHQTLVGLAVVFFHAYDRLLFLLLFLGIIRRKVIPRHLNYDFFIALIIVFYIFIFALFYVTAKYLVALISISLFWAAIGFYELYRYIILKIPPGKIQTISKLSSVIFVILLALVIMSLFPEALRIQDRDKLGRKKVGLWIKENCAKSPCILTDSLRLAFYAEAEAVRFQNRPGISNYDDLIKFVKSSPSKDTYRRKINYVVVDKATIGKYCPDFLESVNPSDLEMIHVQPKLKHSAYGELVVYEVK